MKITFLGTGAADWKIEKHRDMEGFRRNSSLLIDDCLLVDPGPNVPDALETFRKDAGAIRWIINTHKHGDHYCSETVERLRSAPLLELSAGESMTVGRYTISALQANHATCAEAVHFIISDGERNLFYGLDGAWLMYGEVAAIKKNGIDLAVLDATVGWKRGDYRIFEHNDLFMVLEMKEALSPSVQRFVISHMARTLHGPHGELAEEMRPYGIEVAYDGWETEV